MKVSRLAGALALAASVAAPAFAQSDTAQGASVAPMEKAAARQNAAAPEKQIKADSTRSTSDLSANANVNSPSVSGAYVAPSEAVAAKQNAKATDKQAKADSTRSTTDLSANANDNSPKVAGATVAPNEVAAAKQQAALDCASHPQAGKLADKSTGEAKEHSASAVHEDCSKVKTAKKKSSKPAKTASNQ